MKKVLILCLHRPERAPSQRFRFEQYLTFLSENGYQFDFSYLLSAVDDKAFYSSGSLTGKIRIVLKSIRKRLREVRRAGKYDLIFVQREAFMLGTAYFEKAIAAKAPMIFDYDDSIWMQVVSDANKKFAFLKDGSKTSKIIQASSMVFAGNEFLAAYARNYNSNVVIVPTTIDTDQYKRVDVPHKKGVVCIGWSGSFSTIEHFRRAIPALQKIKAKYGNRVSFKIIGDGNYYCKELETQGLPWVGDTELRDLSEIDIGIMPLPDTEWAKGKCGLKGLQYMALGIPSLMSPVGVNKDIINDGINGYLPDTEEEWIRDLSLLIDNADLRLQVGKAGQKTVEDNYSVNSCKQLYLQYFDQLTNNKRLKTSG